MTTSYLIDTDIMVDFLRGITQAVKFLHKVAPTACYISPITIAELYVGVREGKERKILDEFIREFHVTALSAEIAIQGGLYRRDYGKSHAVGLADAIIAATASELKLKLVTLNKKHYPMLKDIYVPYQKP